jgi:hypothetical protein
MLQYKNGLVDAEKVVLGNRRAIVPEARRCFCNSAIMLDRQRHVEATVALRAGASEWDYGVMAPATLPLAANSTEREQALMLGSASVVAGWPYDCVWAVFASWFRASRKLGEAKTNLISSGAPHGATFTSEIIDEANNGLAPLHCWLTNSRTIGANSFSGSKASIQATKRAQRRSRRRPMRPGRRA